MSDFERELREAREENQDKYGSGSPKKDLFDLDREYQQEKEKRLVVAADKLRPVFSPLFRVLVNETLAGGLVQEDGYIWSADRTIVTKSKSDYSNVDYVEHTKSEKYAAHITEKIVDTRVGGDSITEYRLTIAFGCELQKTDDACREIKNRFGISVQNSLHPWKAPSYLHWENDDKSFSGFLKIVVMPPLDEAKLKDVIKVAGIYGPYYMVEHKSHGYTSSWDRGEGMSRG